MPLGEIALNLYHDHVLPVLIDFAMRQHQLADYRNRVVPAAEGRVLEVGIGSGLNLPLYAASVDEIVGLDPSPQLLAKAREAAERIGIPVELIEGSAERIPLDNKSIDTVITTWTLCSIPDVQGALREMRRVLKPDGRLLFVEHGRAPDRGVAVWQDRLTPLWRRIGGGCHLNRAVDDLLETSGFKIERIEQGYMRGPKAIAFMYEGSAKAR